MNIKAPAPISWYSVGQVLDAEPKNRLSGATKTLLTQHRVLLNDFNSGYSLDLTNSNILAKDGDELLCEWRVDPTDSSYIELFVYLVDLNPETALTMTEQLRRKKFDQLLHIAAEVDQKAGDLCRS